MRRKIVIVALAVVLVGGLAVLLKPPQAKAAPPPPVPDTTQVPIAKPAQLDPNIPTRTPDGIAYRNKILPNAILATMDQTAINSAELAMAGESNASPLDVVSCSGLADWADVTAGYYQGDGYDWINAQGNGSPTYPTVEVPGEYGPELGNPIEADMEVCHDQTTNEYFMRYYPGYSWPNSSYVGVQAGTAGYNGPGPLLGWVNGYEPWNYDPVYCSPKHGSICPVITASAGGMGANEQFWVRCSPTTKHEFQLFWVESGFYISADTVYTYAYFQYCPVMVLYQAADRYNQADWYYSDVGLCS